MRVYVRKMLRGLLLACVLLLLPCTAAKAAGYSQTYMIPQKNGKGYIGYEYVPELSGKAKIKSVKWSVSDKKKIALTTGKNSLYATVVYKKTGTTKVTRAVRLKNGKTVKSTYVFRVYAKNSWFKVNGHTYYYLKDGSYASDKWIGSRYVNEYGHWDAHFQKTPKGIRYRNPDGTYAGAEWVQSSDGNEYYFDSNGIMAADTWIDGVYVQKDGKKKSGLVNTENGWKLQDYSWGWGEDEEEPSYASNCWLRLNGRQVYFDSQGNMVKNGWQKIDNGFYYFDAAGYLVTEKWIDGYYVNENGTRVKNQRVGDYYVGKNGKKITNRWVKSYYVNSSGKIMKNRWIKGSYVGLNGKKIAKMRYASGKTAVNGACIPVTKSQLKKLVSTAEKQLGKPYIWGGNGPDGFDCSGFVNYCYRALGYSLPRTTYYLYNSGVNIDPLDVSEWQVGDLLVNQGDINGGSAGHVVMYIGNGRVIHCTSGGVQFGDAQAFAGRYARVRRLLYVK